MDQHNRWLLVHHSAQSQEATGRQSALGDKSSWVAVFRIVVGALRVGGNLLGPQHHDQRLRLARLLMLPSTHEPIYPRDGPICLNLGRLSSDP